jgi:hypothetical protein
MNGFFFDPAPQPPPEPRPQKSAENHRRHQSRDTQPTWNLLLESTGCHVASRFLLESPMAAALVTEDLCWQAATEDWKRRRPPWWHPRARAAWKAEGDELVAQAVRLRQMADYVFHDL